MCEKRGEVVARAGVNKPGNKCHGGRFVSSHIYTIGVLFAIIRSRSLYEKTFALFRFNLLYFVSCRC